MFSKINYKFKLLFKQYLIGMSDMLFNCSSLTSLNLSNFNINNVINLEGMFKQCSSLTALGFLVLISLI